MKRFLLAISILVMILILSSCMLVPTEKSSSRATTNLSRRPALGNIFMPSDFLAHWFASVPVFDVNSLHSRLQLIAPNSGISSTQQLLTQPVLSNLPSDYNSQLATFSNGGNIPDVQDQWYNNTCWAFATVESLESAMVTQLGSSQIGAEYPFISNPSSPTLSTQFVSYNNANWNITNLYNLSYQETNEDEGGNLFFSFYDLVRRGVPLASDFPYLDYMTTSNGLQQGYPYILWNPTNDAWTSHLVHSISTLVIDPNKFSNYTTFINTIKSAIIKYGAIAVQFDVYSNFDTFNLNEPAGPNGWVYTGPASTDSYEGGHATILVGWDDNWTYGGVNYGPVWILENSWGKSWGDQGFWRQPMITQSQFELSTIGNWQFEGSEMYVPYLGS